MRFLLISDTHGRLGVIDELADRVRADAVIHAGDFGFFDEGSFERLSDRELRFHVVHSDPLNLGSPGRTRTSDRVVNSHLLYQLSYPGMGRNVLGIVDCTGLQVKQEGVDF